MTIYKCSNCNISLKNKKEYESHIEISKLKCSLDDIVKQELKCSHCGILFSRIDSLNRHINYFCNSKSKTANQKEDIVCNFDNKTNDFIDEKEVKISNSNKNSCDKNGIVESTNYSNNKSSFSYSLVADKNTKECQFCKKSISASNFSKHLKVCKNKKEQEKGKIQIYEDVYSEIKEAKERISMLENENKQLRQQIGQTNSNNKKIIINNTKNKTINKTINNNTQNNTQNNTFNNYEIKLLAFGKEDYTQISDAEYKFIINKGFKSLEELVRCIHFNDKRPENHNIYISNMRDNNANVYDGQQWIKANRKETIDQLYQDKKEILEEKFDELVNELPEHSITKFNRFLNDQQDDDISNKIKYELKLRLYNNKNIPTKTKKKLGLLKDKED